MFLQKKVDRAMNWLQDKPKTQGRLDLEKNDLLAIIIAAIMVFGPIFIVLGLIMVLVL